MLVLHFEFIILVTVQKISSPDMIIVSVVHTTIEMCMIVSRKRIDEC